MKIQGESYLHAALSILARSLLATIFLIGPLVNLIPNFNATALAMQATGVPAPAVLLTIAIAMLLMGSLSLITGFHARVGALLLVLFLIPATYYFHAPGRVPATPESGSQIIHFLKNIGLLGALMLVILQGPGPGSIDKEIT